MRAILLIAALLSLKQVAAQDSIEITESVSTFSTGSHNTLSFVVNNANLKDVSGGWSDLLKDWKCKPKGKTEWQSEECKAKTMGDRPFYVVSVVEEVPGTGVRVRAAFDLGGAYMSSTAHPDRFSAAKLMLHNLAVEQAKVVVRTEIAAAQKLLADRQAEFAALQKAEQKLESDIADFQKKIEEAKVGIGASRQAQATKLVEVDAQRAVVQSLENKLNAVK